MEGSRPLIGRLIFCVAALIAFTLCALAQETPARKTAEQYLLTKLSAEDVQMILQVQAARNRRALQALANDPEQRKKVLETLRQAMAVASEAVKNGFADEASIKMQLELARSEILATAYNDKLAAAADKPDEPAPPFTYIEEKDVNAFFDAPANSARYKEELGNFLEFLDQMRKKNSEQGEMSGEERQFVISQWKKVTYGAIKAKKMNLVDRKIELQYKLQQTLLLSRAYAEEKLKDRLTPTADEINAYIAANPKFSKKLQRARAEEILAKVKAGGNFAALADEYTEDPGNKDPQTRKGQGGFYDWRNRDAYVKEFSDAAWALETGQTSGIVETQFGYHIIKLEGKRVDKATNTEQVKVRHILVSTLYKEEPDPAGQIRSANSVPLKTREEAAEQELAAQKQKKILDDITQRNPIDLPADFTIVVPPGPDPALEQTLPAPMPAPVKSTAAVLPVKIKSYLNKTYRGWKLSPSTPDCTAEHPNNGLVSGNFNGDKDTDYAVKLTRGNKGYIIAFLRQNDDYKAFVLHNYTADEATGSYLTTYRKGEVFSYGKNKNIRLRYDAPTDYRCESDVGGIHYYRNGKFVGY